MSRKIQLIVIKDELGSYKRVLIPKRPLFFGLFAVLFLVVALGLFSFYAYNSSKKFYGEKEELSKKVALLSRELRSLKEENRQLACRVEKLQREKKSTVDALARRLKLIDRLIKEVGVVPVKEGEGGESIPIEKLFTSEQLSFNDAVKSLDTLIRQVKTTPLGWPTEGRVTSKFGIRRDPINGRLEFHPGVDIANRWGTPVRAPADGVVVKAGWCGELGKCVEIYHGHGLKTYYGHLAKIVVYKGEKVRRGMIIGIMGSTGRSTGPHLHYAVKLYNRLLNPLPFMEAVGVR
jgi:murein DD-endopeptidase MepM/ murein hydrolase activator NlpD